MKLQSRSAVTAFILEQDRKRSRRGHKARTRTTFHNQKLKTEALVREAEAEALMQQKPYGQSSRSLESCNKTQKISVKKS